MNYNISESNLENFVIGTGWPSYKNISIKEMADTIIDNDDTSLNSDTTPRYDTQEGNSRVVPNMADVTSKEAKLVKQLYYTLNKTLSPYVESVINEYEYVGSPIYDEDGIDRETLSQLVSKVIELASEHLDEIQEIQLSDDTPTSWNSEDMLYNMTQSLVLAEIFLVRRPKYRRAKQNYNYNQNGEYNGVNPQ